MDENIPPAEASSNTNDVNEQESGGKTSDDVPTEPSVDSTSTSPMEDEPKVDDEDDADVNDDDSSDSDSDDSTPPVEDPTELILKAVSHKEDGNTFFKSGDLNRASREYRKGTSVIKGLNKKNTGDEQIKSLLLSLQTNLSMVCFKQDKPKLSRDVASKALSVDSTNVKALYRRAVAHRKLGDLDAACTDLKVAFKKEPNNTAVRKELISIKKELDTQKEKAKKGLQRAFSKGGGGSFLYDDKEEEMKRKAQEKKKKKEAEQEELKKRKVEWEDECVTRLSKDEPVISFEDWEKERKEKLENEKNAKKKAKKEAQEVERLAAKASRKDDSDASDDELTKSEMAMLRGYKKTSDGRTTSYFSREQTASEKALLGDITPQRVEATTTASSYENGQTPVSTPGSSASTPTVASSSAWNQAGTWEERNTTEWCTSRLSSRIETTLTTTESFTGRVEKVSELNGDASVAMTNGKKRYIFDYNAEVTYEIVDQSDDVVATGTMKLPDICSGVTNEDLEVVILGWKKAPSENMEQVTECRTELSHEIRKSVLTFVQEFNSFY